jgi:hypothetical protein
MLIEGIHNLYCSLQISRVIEVRTLRWVRTCNTYCRERKCVKDRSQNPKGRRLLVHLHVVREILLKQVLKKEIIWIRFM